MVSNIRSRLEREYFKDPEPPDIEKVRSEHYSLYIAEKILVTEHRSSIFIMKVKHVENKLKIFLLTFQLRSYSAKHERARTQKFTVFYIAGEARQLWHSKCTKYPKNL